MHYSFRDILFVVVLYDCKIKDSKTLVSLENSLKDDQFINLFIYDNSPVSQTLPIGMGNTHIFYKSDIYNSGVSKAYNEGYSYAVIHGYKWIILLDQDTFITYELLEEYVNVINGNKSIQVVVPRLMNSENVVYSPSLQLFYKSFLYKYKPGINKLKFASVLNSGMLLSLNLFAKTGGYNEKIYLDYSDMSFIRKLRKVEKVFYVMNTRVVHEISSNDTDYKKVLFRFRHYCICTKEFAHESSLLVVFWCYIRSLKLSLKFKTTSFVREFKKCFL